ncbi:MAG: nitrogen regulation protein NR(II) [bacterium]
MNSASNFDEKLLRRRKAMVTSIVVLTVIVLLGFNFGSWIFLKQMGSYLEEELGRRLQAVATLTSKSIESGGFTYYIENYQMSLILPSLNSILTKVHEANELQGVYLVDEMYRVLASSREIFSPGERLTFLEEDSVSFTQAAHGVAAVSPMFVVEGNRFKSAYAPVLGSLDDVVAILVVQANADFFNLLRFFKRGLIFFGVVSLAVAVLFSMFLFWAISLLIKTHESLRQAERLAAMGQMAATVAHEIRNPLSIIKSTSDVLKSKYAPKDDSDELFEFIPSEVRRLNRLVSNFLSFARDRDLELNATDLNNTVENSLAFLEDEIHEVNVKLETDFENLPPICHDEDAVNQVLLNLTLNAIQSINGEGRIRIRLRKEARKGRQFAKVEVEDTGCGFDAEQKKIFEPFYTTKTSGSGLGLAICKRLIEKHGGWIEAESQKGKGTIMRFYLPVTLK